ncbi:MAG: GDP-L-fucose synthase, partial [Pyrinomonadaceae bacterium]
MFGKNSKIYISGSGGMVGSAIRRHLENSGYVNLLGRTSKQLNLINQSAVENFFSNEKPEFVILAAGKVGGILANDTYRADFIYQNLMIQANVIHAAHQHNVKKLVSLGSSCIYPKFAAQPIKEETLLTGELETTNEPYAVAKIAGIKLCENYFRQYGANFFSVMPTNLYGAGDKFDLSESHVIPALIRKFHEAQITKSPNVVLWGTGAARREFLYADDLAQAVVFLLENLDAADLYAQDVSQI